MSDDELIRAFQRGDAGAFGTLYARYRNRAFFYALAMTGDDLAAEEAVQEAFLAFLRNANKYKPAGSFRRYLFAAIRSRVIDAERKAHTRREEYRTEALDLFESPQAPPAAPGGEDLARLVGAALASLPEEQREVVVLKIYENATFREIADLTGVSENTAASRYRYGFEKLKAQLEGIRKNG